MNSGLPDSERYLTAYVSEDAKVVGIEHDTGADWQKVHDAHIALRDRLNERLAERDKCPRKPTGTAALTPSHPSRTRAVSKDTP